MRVRRRRTGALVAACTAMAVATGCADSGGDGKEVAAVSTGEVGAEPSGKGGDGRLAEYIEGMRTWVGCMRDAGVDLPDPDAEGQVEIGVPAKEWKSDPKYRNAQMKCSDKHPTLPDELEKAMQPEPTEKEKAKNREYASCMQDHGAADFPDVGEDGNFVEEPWDSAAASAKSAARYCDKTVYNLDTSSIIPKG